MTTWNTITIERPGALTLDTLPDALTGDAEIWEGRTEWDERETVPERFTFGRLRAERPGNPDGDIIISGHSKWTPEEAIKALIELSKTTGRITHRQEWDDDEAGQSVTVYENGAEVEELAQVSDLVPANLHELIADARTALMFDAPSPAVVDALSGTLRALVDALDPKGAQA